MQCSIKGAALTLSMASLLIGPYVLAEPTNDSASVKSEAVNAAPEKCDREQRKQKHFDTLKADLKLSATQETGWAAWVAKIKEGHKGQDKKHLDREAWASLPAPERLEKMLAFSKEHVALQEAHLAATKTFYATLTPEQRLIFDKESRFGHHDRFGKRWK